MKKIRIIKNTIIAKKDHFAKNYRKSLKTNINYGNFLADK